jgi:hypothetical protein
MVEKKVTEKKVATKTTATAKKTTVKKTTTAKKVASAFVINAESVGFKAGDVYQALSVSEAPMTVAEISKAAKITTEETLLGMGWLLKEGKIKGEENKFCLA